MRNTPAKGGPLTLLTRSSDVEARVREAQVGGEHYADLAIPASRIATPIVWAMWRSRRVVDAAHARIRSHGLQQTPR